MNKDITLVKQFIFNDEVQKILSDINNHFMDFNILEITGMGTQEIKHSNILAWLLGDNEHKLGYDIFVELLKKIHSQNQNVGWDDLQKYIYLDTKKNLIIQREQNNIDLLIEDKQNGKVFVFEIKVQAEERIDGLDGGQLSKYKKFIEKKYEKYDKYFIFLTPDLEKASQENWACADYQMITDILLDKINHEELLLKTELIFKSYIDLLKRRSIVKDEKLIELCADIWKKNRNALDIIMKNRPHKATEIRNIIKEFGNEVKPEQVTGDAYKFFIKLNEQSPLIYIISYSSAISSGSRGKIQFSIVRKKEESVDISKISIKSISYQLKDRSGNRNGYIGLSSGFHQIGNEDNLDEFIEWLKLAKLADVDV